MNAKPKSKKPNKKVDGIITSAEIKSVEQEVAHKTAGIAQDTPAINLKATQVETKPKKVEKLERQANKEAKDMKRSRGFLVSTIRELRMVNWPKPSYVTRWSAIIIVFTAILGSTLGFVDYYAASGLSFVDCTSPGGSKSKTVNECLQDLTTQLTFRPYLFRDGSTAASSSSSAPAPELESENANPAGGLTLPITDPTNPNSINTPVKVDNVNNQSSSAASSASN